MKSPFNYDSYSDQAGLLKDKTYKKEMRKKEFVPILKTLLTSFVVLPLSIIMTPFVKRKEIDSSLFFCIGVDFQRESELTLSLLDDLNVDRILVRLKLWEMDSLDDLKLFLQKTKTKKVTLKIMQDREHIEDLKLLEDDLRTIFDRLDDLVDIYEIGTTINRTKWGFFSVDEYSKFYQVAYNLKSQFPNIKLIGSGVIDFEYHFTAHTLFNFFNYKYDGVSALLYVDRRGAPEYSQMGFTFSDKIALLSTMVWLSKKTKHKLHITETNYPISNTAPYSPTSEMEAVSLDDYANFMLRYHLLAFASQQVDSVSWHQLMARGYGLIDNIDGINYYPAYMTYKYMVSTFKNAQFLRLDITRDYYILQCLIDENLLQIHWSLKETTLKNEDFFDVYSRDGEKIDDETLNIGSSPLYIYITDGGGKKVNSTARIT